MITDNFYRGSGARGPINTQKAPNVSIQQMEYWHPNSVWASLLSNANWVSKLRISKQAKRLTRLRGRQFRVAVLELESPNTIPNKSVSGYLQACGII